MSIKNPQKNPKYFCHYCEYKTNNKKDYIKHLATLKHINLANINDLSTENPQKSQSNQKEFKCKNCGNTYKGRDGLWRHSKKCKEPTVAEVFANNNSQQLTELVLKMVEQNQDLTKQIVELAKNSGSEVPKNGFRDSLTLEIGSEKVWIKFLGQGHTRDNVVGYFPSEDVLFGGCLIKEMGASKGYLGDANVDQWSFTVDKVKKTFPHVKHVVPGHGEAGDSSLLDYTQKLFTKQN